MRLKRKPTRISELSLIIAQLTPEQVVQNGASLSHRISQINDQNRFQVIPTARVEYQGQAGDEYQVKIINEDLTRGPRETLSLTVDKSTADMIRWIAAQIEAFYPPRSAPSSLALKRMRLPC